MALKAGLVGVNPKGVDKNGMPKSDTAAISAEVDAIAANLKANNKDFVFAYDGTSQKYGYKAGADGDFVPFDSGAAGIGWIAPDDLITTGLTPTRCTIENGGYYVDTENNICYVDIIVKRTSSSSTNVAGFPKGSGTALAVNDMDSGADDDYNANTSYSISTGTTSTITMGSGFADQLVHVWGQYNILD